MVSRPLWDRPSVIVTSEKHDPRYLDATTEEAFRRSALALLRERFDSGDYYDRPENLAKEEPPIDIDEAGLAFIPDGSAAHRLHEQQVSARARWQRMHATYVRWYEDARKALGENDGALAWRCLLSRRDYEYEGVRLEAIETF